MISVEDLLRGRSTVRRQLPLSYAGFEHAASYKNAARRAHGRLQAVNVGWTHHSYSSLNGLWLRRYMLYSPSYSNGPEICLLPITQVCSCFDTVNLAAADALSEVLSRCVMRSYFVYEHSLNRTRWSSMLTLLDSSVVCFGQRRQVPLGSRASVSQERGAGGRVTR